MKGLLLFGQKKIIGKPNYGGKFTNNFAHRNYISHKKISDLYSDAIFQGEHAGLSNLKDGEEVASVAFADGDTFVAEDNGIALDKTHFLGVDYK